MSKNANFHNQRRNKNDEFYTQLSDIEKEMKHYRSHFKDKIIFCNCDDPTESNFWRYFHLNFQFLGLKKLISTHYDQNNPSYKLEYCGGDDNDFNVYTNKVVLQQNGDFRSDECIEILKEADIVITNPPFSLFREYIKQLMDYNKKFIVLGNMGQIIYKEIFSLIKDNKMWTGYHTGNMKFNTPSNKMYDVRVEWYTNLEIKKRHEEIDFVEKYNPQKYHKYDNYDQINVDKTLDIPCDYFDIMGVPISFMDKYNPEQFELIGCTRSFDKSPQVELLRTDKKKRDNGFINGKEKYVRLLIKRKQHNDN